MQIPRWIPFVFLLLAILDNVAAWPPNGQHDISQALQTGAAVVLGTYLTYKYLNSPQWAHEKQELEIPKVETHEDFSPTASINPRPTATLGTANNTTQDELLTLPTREPCITNTVFASDPSDVIIPYHGAPPMVKLTNLTATCNGTVIETYDFVTILVADIPKFFQNSDIVDEDKKSLLPAAAEPVYPNISLGVNIPEPESSALSQPSVLWQLTEDFRNGYQDSKLKPFVESARRKLYIFRFLLGKTLGHFVSLLPTGCLMGAIMTGIPLIVRTWPGTRRVRRRLFVRCVSPIARSDLLERHQFLVAIVSSIARWNWLQRVNWMFREGIKVVDEVMDEAVEDGPQVQQPVVLSAVEVQTIIGNFRDLVSLVERLSVRNGGQPGDQGDDDDDDDDDDDVDGSFVDTFEFPAQLQSGMPPHVNTNDVLPARYYNGGTQSRNTKHISGIFGVMPATSRVKTAVAEAPASSDTAAAEIPLPASPVEPGYPPRCKSRSPSSWMTSSKRSRSPSKLPQFTETRSTRPIAEKVRGSQLMSIQEDGKSKSEVDDWKPFPKDERGRLQINRSARPSVANTKKTHRPKSMLNTYEVEDEALLLGYSTPAAKSIYGFVDSKIVENSLGPAPSDEQTASKDDGQVAPVVSSLDRVEKLADGVATENDSEANISDTAEAISPLTEHSEYIPSEDAIPPSVELEQQNVEDANAELELDPNVDAQADAQVDAFAKARLDALEKSCANARAQQPVIETQRPPPLDIIEEHSFWQPMKVTSPPDEETLKPSIAGGIPELSDDDDEDDVDEDHIDEDDDDDDLDDSRLKNKGKTKDKGKGKGRSNARGIGSRKAQKYLASDPSLANILKGLEFDFEEAQKLPQDVDHSRCPPSSKPDTTDSSKSDDIFKQYALGEDIAKQYEAGKLYFQGKLRLHAESNEASSSKHPSTDLHFADQQPDASAVHLSSNVPSPQSEGKTTGNTDAQLPAVDSSNASAQPDPSNPAWREWAVQELLDLMRADLPTECDDADLLDIYLDGWGWENVNHDNVKAICQGYLGEAAKDAAERAARDIAEGDSEPSSSEAVGRPVAPEGQPASNEQLEANENQEDAEKKTPKPEDNAPPVPHVDDDDDDDDGGSGPPPSSGAIIEEVVPVVEKPAEENSHDSAVDGNDNESHRRSILRTPETPVNNVSSIFGEERRGVRFATHLNGSDAVDTHRFSFRAAPAVIQQDYSMEVDAEGREATGAVAPTPPAFVQPLPVVAEGPSQQNQMEDIPSEVPDQQVEMDGVESSAPEEGMDGVEEHGETVVNQDEALLQQTVWQFPGLGLPQPPKVTVAQDQELTMSEAPAPQVSPFNVVTPPFVATQHAGYVSKDNNVPSAPAAGQQGGFMGRYSVVPPPPPPAAGQQGGFMGQYNVVPPPLPPPAEQRGGHVSQYNVIPPPLPPNRPQPVISQEPSVYDDYAQDLESYEALAAECPELQDEENKRGSLVAVTVARLKAEKAAEDEKKAQKHGRNPNQAVQGVDDPDWGFITQENIPKKYAGAESRAALKPRLRKPPPSPEKPNPTSTSEGPDDGTDPDASQLPEIPASLAASIQGWYNTRAAGAQNPASPPNTPGPNDLVSEDLPASAPNTGTVDDDDIPTLNEEERNEPQVIFEEPEVNLFEQASQRKAENESREKLDFGRKWNKNREPSFNARYKRGRDEDGEECEQEDQEHSAPKRQLEASTGERFSLSREGRQYQDREACRNGEAGSPEYQGQGDGTDGLAVPKDEDEEDAEEDEEDDEEDEEDEYEDRDAKELKEDDPYGDLKDFDSQEPDGIACLARIFHALDRLNTRGPSRREIEEPKRIIVNRHRTYHFGEVANNPYWCDSPLGRAWLTFNWPTFRHDHAERLYVLVHNIVDEHVEKQIDAAHKAHQRSQLRIGR
ncbi:hypothetical protein H2200_003817 [Cladophialophora chaetospira]|uniref:Uncharacterized protein n=1 Tax=Cladophialophora chaetospira TaxID=386627 RepID=A0AA38XEY0_9EURO|nr:hypothetical protein H2200_003817 [Cladophialophora chaetospira]